ncbi:SRPBCC family protein [Nocardia xishanensis]|uniref:SRPBCC family protein n=1 Tax=Nocardia xishanensis TaxID=238964 RepID=A0ABW7X092_9NOCA
MPGDEFLPHPELLATRAVTVAAEPAAVWPWLIQIGPGRGGAYTYDWIENLFGLDMHSANTILPQFQDLSVGDTLALGSTGPRMRAQIIERNRALVFASDDGDWIWSFGLYRTPEGTRLVSRNRIRRPGASPLGKFLYALVMEPGSLVMERKMLRGIKQRAERTPVMPGRADDITHPSPNDDRSTLTDPSRDVRR